MYESRIKQAFLLRDAPALDPRPSRVRWWIAASLLMHLMSALAIGYSNADRFHDGIWRSMPWTKGDCGNLWSLPAMLMVIAISVGATLFARQAVLHVQLNSQLRRIAKSLYWLGVLQVGYWLLATIGNMGASCSGGQL